MKRTECTDPFLRAYLDAALWTTDPSPGQGDYVESGRSLDIWPLIPADFISAAKVDCAKFEAENAELLEKAGDFEQNGHDFWLSRNGHGSGFFDHDYDENVRDGLQEAARRFGECWLDEGIFGANEEND